MKNDFKFAIVSLIEALLAVILIAVYPFVLLGKFLKELIQKF